MAKKVVSLDNLKVVKKYIDRTRDDVQSDIDSSTREYLNDKLNEASQNIYEDYMSKYSELTDKINNVKENGTGTEEELKKLELQLDALNANTNDKFNTLEVLNQKINEDYENLYDGVTSGTIFTPGQFDEIINTAMIKGVEITDDSMFAESMYAQKLVGLIGNFGSVKASKILGDEIEGKTIVSNNTITGTNDPVWMIGNSGEGWLAQKNISWDSAGNVKFGPGVKLSWSSISDAESKVNATLDKYDSTVKGYIKDYVFDVTNGAATKQDVENAKNAAETAVKNLKTTFQGDLDSKMTEINAAFDDINTWQEVTYRNEQLEFKNTYDAANAALEQAMKDGNEKLVEQLKKLKDNLEYEIGKNYEEFKAQTETVSRLKYEVNNLNESALTKYNAGDLLATTLISQTEITEGQVSTPALLATKIVGLVGTFGTINASKIVGTNIQGYTISSPTQIKDENGDIVYLDENLLELDEKGRPIQAVDANGNLMWKDPDTKTEPLYKLAMELDERGEWVASKKPAELERDQIAWLLDSDGSGWVAERTIKWDYPRNEEDKVQYPEDVVTEDEKREWRRNNVTVTIDPRVDIRWESIKDGDVEVMQPIATAQETADKAQDAADAAQAAADAAQLTADTTISNINDWAKDGVLNTTEQKELWRTGQELVVIYKQLEKSINDLNNTIEDKGEDWQNARSIVKIPTDSESVFGQFKTLFYNLVDLGNDNSIIGGAIKHHVKGLPEPIGAVKDGEACYNVEIDNDPESNNYLGNVTKFYEMHVDVTRIYADKMSEYARALADDWTGDYFRNWADDNLINEQEQASFKDNLEQLTAEYLQIHTDISNVNNKAIEAVVGVIDATEFNSAWTKIERVLKYYSGGEGFDPTDTDTYEVKDGQIFIKIVDYDYDENPDGGDYDWDWIAYYYKKKQEILTAIAQKESEIALKLGKDHTNAEVTEAKRIAKEDADAAKAAAAAAQLTADGTIDKLNDWASDNKLSPIEQKELLKQKNEIEDDYLKVCADVDTANTKDGINISTDVFTQAYLNAIDAIDEHVDIENGALSGNTTTINKESFENISAYYTNKQAILNTIAIELSEYANRTATGYANEAKNAADRAQKAADDAQADATETNTYLNTWASDSWIVKQEMHSMIEKLKEMGFEKAQIDLDIKNYTDTNFGEDQIYIEKFENYEDYVSAYELAKNAIEYHTKTGSFSTHTYDVNIGEDIKNPNNENTISIKIQRNLQLTIINTDDEGNEKELIYNIDYDNISKYYEVKQRLLNEIADKLSDLSKRISIATAEGFKVELETGAIAEINENIETANTNIQRAQADANKANKNLDQWSEDKWIVIQEQVSLTDKLEELTIEYNKIISDIDEYDNGDKWKNNYIKDSTPYKEFTLAFSKLQNTIAYHTKTSPFDNYGYGEGIDAENGSISVIKGLSETITINENTYYIGWENITEYYSYRQNILNYISKRLSDYAKDLVDSAKATINNAIGVLEGSLDKATKELNNRLDGVVESYYEEGKPTANSELVNSWGDDKGKYNHVGDTYTNIETYIDDDKTPDSGKSWRWCECTNTSGITDFITVTIKDVNGNDVTKNLHWHPIADSDAVKALLEAAKAQSTADGKCSTFLKKPTTLDNSGYLYRIGDLWIINSEDSKSDYPDNVKVGDILTANCNSEIFDKSHWDKLVNYTDDTAANDARAAADAAQGTANTAEANAKAANTNLNYWAQDKYIVSQEMTALTDKLEELTAEKAKIDTEWESLNTTAKNLYNSTYTDFGTAFTNMKSAIEYHSISGDFKNWEYSDNSNGEAKKDMGNGEVAILIQENNPKDSATATKKINDKYVGWGNITNYYASRQIILNAIAAIRSEEAKIEAEDLVKKSEERVNASINEAKASLTNLTSEIANDNIISIDEQSTLKTKLAELTSEYEKIVNNVESYDASYSKENYWTKIQGSTNYTNFTTGYINLSNTIEYHTASGDFANYNYGDQKTANKGIKKWDKSDKVNNCDVNFDNISEYYAYKTIILDVISKQLADVAKGEAASSATAQFEAASAAASAANALAATAQAAASNAVNNALAANNKLADWAKDGWVSPEEQKNLKQQLAELEYELNIIISKINEYNSSTTLDITSTQISDFCGSLTNKDGGAWQKLKDTIDYHTNSGNFSDYKYSTSEKSSYDSIKIHENDNAINNRNVNYNNIKAYYAARQTMLDLLASKYADRAQAAAEAHSINISKFTSTAFTRTNTDISNIQPTGGSFTDPKPKAENGITWYDGIPDGTATIWSTTRVFYANDSQLSDWKKPQKMSNTSEFLVRYSTVATNPGNPTSNSGNWSHTASTNSIWMATQTVSNGASATSAGWNVIKVKGETGNAGSSLTMKGKVSTLPTSGSTKGDTYVLTTDNCMYTWSGTGWINCGKVKGEDGAKGADGRGIVSTSISYAVANQGNNADSISESSWKPTLQTANPGQYLWTRTIIDYTTGDDTVSYSVSYISKNGEKGETGANGTSVTVNSITYLAGSSPTQAPSGTWLSSPPSVKEGEYLWTKTTFSDGKDAYSVAKQGQKGIQGDKGEDGYNTFLHIKYADITNTSILDSSGHILESAWSNAYNNTFKPTANGGETPGSWMGTCTTRSQASSVNDPDITTYNGAKNYIWTKIKGENGKDADPENLKTILDDYKITSNTVAAKTFSSTETVALPSNTKWYAIDNDGKFATKLSDGTTVSFNSDGNPTTKETGNGTKTGPTWQIGWDGTGHLAGGNISWEKTGNLTVSGTINGNIGKKGGDSIGPWKTITSGAITYIGDATTTAASTNYFGSNGTFRIGGSTGIVKSLANSGSLVTPITIGDYANGNGLQIAGNGKVTFGNNVTLNWNNATADSYKFQTNRLLSRVGSDFEGYYEYFCEIEKMNLTSDPSDPVNLITYKYLWILPDKFAPDSSYKYCISKTKEPIVDEQVLNVDIKNSIISNRYTVNVKNPSSYKVSLTDNITQITGNTISTTNISGDNISGGTITGSTISSNTKLNNHSYYAWQINNNGTGWLADKNITWDSAGKVTLGNDIVTTNKEMKFGNFMTYDGVNNKLTFNADSDIYNTNQNNFTITTGGEVFWDTTKYYEVTTTGTTANLTITPRNTFDKYVIFGRRTGEQGQWTANVYIDATNIDNILTDRNKKLIELEVVTNNMMTLNVVLKYKVKTTALNKTILSISSNKVGFVDLYYRGKTSAGYNSFTYSSRSEEATTFEAS